MRTTAFSTLMLGLVSGTISTTAFAQQPKVVVGITVDQLRTDYLEQLRPYFGADGFNRLFAEALYLPDVDFKGTVADAPAGNAVVYTGAWPAVNGMPAAEILDLQLHKSVPTLAADNTKYRYDYTPQNLRLSTIADELFINSGGLSKIYSIAGDPQAAVAAAGHAGTAAIWADEATGRWTTPAYYGSLPPAAANRNRTAPLQQKATAASWRPLTSAAKNEIGKNWHGADFSYSFTAGGHDALSRFKESPLLNTEITDLAIDLMKSLNSGVADYPGGMLNITYSLAPVTYDYDDDNRPELTDAYLRLDRDIARLLEAANRDFGKGNVMLFLTSTGYADEPAMPEADARIPSGEVTLKQVESLLNAYLSAAYGNADYVALIKDDKLILDGKVAEKRGIDIRRLRSEAKNFLLRMSGVSEVFTLDEVLASDSRRLQNLALRTDAKNAADLFIYFTPGWTVTDDNAFPSKSKKVRLSSPATPAFILAPGVEKATVTTTVDATAIAPTVTSLLRIRSPNGASGKALNLQ